MNKRDNFKDSYRDLNESLDEINDKGKYASWLIIGVIIGRGYQYMRGVKNRMRKRRK